MNEGIGAAAEQVGVGPPDVRAHEHYLRVRDWARRMAAPGMASPTHGELQMAGALAPLWDATAEMIADLRRLCAPLGASEAADFETESSRLAKNIRRDLKRLCMQVGPDLFVPESPILGGFGCRTSVGRCNSDTLKFFNVLVALQDGAVLTEFRRGSARRLVWEIGGGWGGFAYQFKTICPNMTYLVTGTPEMFLVSAVYLMAAFPGARCRFYDNSSSSDDLWRRWEEADFVFAPERAVRDLRPPRLDLTLDVMSLQQMTPERISCHVGRAFELGCRYLYSLHAGNWAAGETPAVWRAIERLYWLHPVPSRVELRKAAVDYSHLIGWRRLRI